MSHYFDANATTPLCPEARDAWLEATDEHWYNPSSPSRASARVHVLLESARTELAAMFDAPVDSVVFNSGATEGNRDVLAYWYRVAPQSHIAISPVEHPSVLENAESIWGGHFDRLPVDRQGGIEIKHLDKLLATGKVSLVSLMAANNETGVIQPWLEVLAICRQRRVAMHIDATQWVGKMPLNGLTEADFVTISGHKFGGPKGIGALMFAPAHSGFSGQRGGVQENDHRAGTENYPAIAAMLAALNASEAERGEDTDSMRRGRDSFESILADGIPGLKIWGSRKPRLSNTSSICLPLGENTRWVRRLDQRGFIVSTGSACATGKEGPSHVLATMGATADESRRTVRISALPGTEITIWKNLAETIIDLFMDMDSGDANPHVIKL